MDARAQRPYPETRLLAVTHLLRACRDRPCGRSASGSCLLLTQSGHWPSTQRSVARSNRDVRFAPESGRCRVAVGCPRRAKSRYRTKSPYSLRRHYDGDGMRHRSADFDDEWRDKLVEFHALADALTKQHPKRIFLSRKIPFELLALISCNYWKWPPTGHQSKQINLATESPH
jgi:hypothetical protein